MVDTPSVSGDLGAVIELEQALLSANLRHSKPLIDELLDPDFVEIGASGRLWSRAETLHALADERAGDPVTISEMDASEVGAGIVLLRYVSDRGARRSRRSSLWRQSDGRWRIVFHQGTLF